MDLLAAAAWAGILERKIFGSEIFLYCWGVESGFVGMSIELCTYMLGSIEGFEAEFDAVTGLG